MRRCGAYLAAALALACPAAAQDTPSAQEFCASAEAEVAARKICESRYQRSAALVLQYAREEGYIAADGDFSWRQVFADLWNWRTLVGMQPKSPYLRCSNAHARGAMIDFRALWDCIVERDPRAALMDAI